MCGEAAEGSGGGEVAGGRGGGASCRSSGKESGRVRDEGEGGVTQRLTAHLWSGSVVVAAFSEASCPLVDQSRRVKSTL